MKMAPAVCIHSSALVGTLAHQLHPKQRQFYTSWSPVLPFSTINSLHATKRRAHAMKTKIKLASE